MDRQYQCNAYTSTSDEYPLADVPEQFWRKVELTYANGQRVVMVYDQEPTDPSELRDLMWRLQTLAARDGFTVQVVESDGTTVTAPPVG